MSNTTNVLSGRGTSMHYRFICGYNLDYISRIEFTEPWNGRRLCRLYNRENDIIEWFGEESNEYKEFEAYLDTQRIL